MIKKLLLVAIVAAGVWFWIQQSHQPSSPTPPTTIEQQISDSEKLLAFAFQSQQSDLQVQGSGKIIRILSDDNEGSRHQRFILQLSHGQTLLVAHNIDLAPRVSNLQIGDQIEFFGVYEWNDKGGVIHWTHKDPRGVHVPGWLRYQGKTYQ